MNYMFRSKYFDGNLEIFNWIKLSYERRTKNDEV